MIRKAYPPSPCLLAPFTEHRIQFDDGHLLSMSNILIVLLFVLVGSAVSQRGEFATKLHLDPTRRSIGFNEHSRMRTWFTAHELILSCFSVPPPQ